MDLITRIDQTAERHAGRLAHVSEGRSLTYGDLRRRSDALAARLQETLPADGSPVAVYGHKEPEMLIAFLGAVKAGHPYVPLDTTLPPDRVRRIVQAAGAPLLLTAADVAAAGGDGVPDPTGRAQPDPVHYIIYTSGSTGEPKGVQITLDGLTHFVDWMLSHQALRPAGEVFLNQAPFSFDLSVMDLYLSLATGGTLFSLTRGQVENPRLMYEALAGSGITAWVSTPSFAELCLAERSFSTGMLPDLRRFLFCGETLPPGVLGQLRQRFAGAEVWNTYGPTETTVAVTAVRLDQWPAGEGPLPVGRPGPAMRVLVLDADGVPVPAGERGEIAIAGPQVSPGYLSNPEQTAARFFALNGERAYRTGDWGRWRDGQLYCEGRMDFQVKLHGYRIELGDVEAGLRRLAAVQEAVVLPAGSGGRPEYLVAWVVLVPGSRPPGDDFAVSQTLRGELARYLPAYMLPRRFRLLEALPLNANGKVDRRRLAESPA